MRLQEIRLHNFRQFAGDQRFGLATGDDRNVTLIFGGNGSGKTTLLNAFLWAMYSDLSDDLENKERLITDTVWRSTPVGQEVSAIVDITFEHDGNSYHVRREVSTRKSTDDQTHVEPKLRVLETTPDGATDEVHAGQDKIDSILPRRLSRFFFFNGERIEHLVSKSAYTEVKAAIKALLGLEQVERALTHLPGVEKKLTNELRRIGGDQAAQIADELNSVRDREEGLSQRVDQLKDDLSSLQEERADVLELLRRHHSAGPVQTQRDDVDVQLEQARSLLKDQRDRRRKLVSEEGFVAFTADLASTTQGIAESLHQRGELPAPLKREFVQDLLDQQRCICGTDLTPGGTAHDAVTAWRARAGLAEVESAWQRLSGEITGLRSRRDELHRQLHSLTDEIGTTNVRIEQLYEQKTRLDGEIAKLPQEDVSQLESKRTELDSRIANVNRELALARRDLDEASTERERLKNELSKAKVKDAIAENARRRVEVAQEVHNALLKIRDIRTESVRRELDQRIKAVFQQITVKPYTPEVTEDFELGLHQLVDGERREVAKSTGENQILSLSFVAAVSQLAKETRANQASDSPYAEGGTFPIVMDAAFGSLDENYQREVSRALPKMAPQMLVLVSKSQGQHVVMQELDPHIGRLGVVTVHSTNVDQHPEDIALRGRSYPYVRTRSQRDWAELVEVS